MGGGDPRGVVPASWTLLEDIQPGPLGAHRLGLGLLSPVAGAGRCLGPPPCFLSGTFTLFLLLGMVGTCEGPCGVLAGSSAPLGLMAQALRGQTHT